MKDFSIQLVNLLLRFLLIHCTASLALSLLGQESFYLLGAVLACLAFIFLFFRQTVKNGALFIIFHAVVFIAATSFFDGIFHTILTLACAAELIYSLAARFKKSENERYSGLISLLFVLLFLTGTYFNKGFYLSLCTSEAVCFIGLKFISDGIFNTSEFLDINEKISDMPYTLIKKRTGFFLILFSAIIIIGMSAGINSGLGDILEYLWNNLLSVIKNIFKNPRNIESRQADFSVFSDTPLPDVSGLNIKTGRPLSPFFEIIGKIVLYFLLFSAAVLTVKILIVKLRNLLLDFYDTREENEKSEFAAPDKTGFAIIKKIKFSKFKDSLPNDAKIRRMYKKYIMKNKENTLPVYLTPKEISQKLKLTLAPEDEQIRTIYEHAKYNNSECTEQDVAEMKRLVKNCKK